MTNETNLNKTRAKVNSAEGLVQKAKDELSLLKTPPRQVDVELYKFQVEEAPARIELLLTEINKAYLRSPLEGLIVWINKKRGEQVEIAEPVMRLISLKPFQLTLKEGKALTED